MIAFLVDNIIWIVAGGLIPLLVLMVLLLSFRKPAQGQALIRSGFGGVRVSLSGLIVLPVIHKAEFMDITLTRLVVERGGCDSLVCRCGTRIDVKAAFFVRVKPTEDNIRKVVQSMGVKGASDVQTLFDLFSDRFIAALKSVSQENGFDELSNREFFKEQVMSKLNLEPEGYVLDVVAIDELAERKQNINTVL